MLSWLRKNETAKTKSTAAQQTVAEQLAKIYRNSILPLEREFHFDKFYSPSYTDATFSARPMVLLIGQYSTGKTTFIKHLLGREYPGCRIGPEPTTDKFTIIMSGSKDRTIPGNAVVVDPFLPFTQLSGFGNNFMHKLECVQLKENEVVDGVTFVDTPGVLSGEKQTVQRNYDFNGVVRWFADNADLIVVLWDANKLDVYDEMKKLISTLKYNTSKVRIVLNKADGVSPLHLMQVNGALMWSLGKSLDTPEVPRVYMGSFWDKPLQNSEYRALFENEQTELFKDLAALPRTGVLAKLNDLVTRARQARAHALLLTHLNNSIPLLFGKQSAQQRMISDLGLHVREVCRKHNINQGDFPPLEMLRENLPHFDFSKIGRLREKDLKALQSAITDEIPKLLLMLTKEDEHGGDQFMQNVTEASPFTQEGTYREQGVFNRSIHPDEYAMDFASLGPDEDGRITGMQAKESLVKSNLPSMVLHKIWTLADINKDGFLDLFEYAVARELIKIKYEGFELPKEVPDNWVNAKNKFVRGGEQSMILDQANKSIMLNGRRSSAMSHSAGGLFSPTSMSVQMSPGHGDRTPISDSIRSWKAAPPSLMLPGPSSTVSLGAPHGDVSSDPAVSPRTPAQTLAIASQVPVDN